NGGILQERQVAGGPDETEAGRGVAGGWRRGQGRLAAGPAPLADRPEPGGPARRDPPGTGVGLEGPAVGGCEDGRRLPESVRRLRPEPGSRGPGRSGGAGPGLRGQGPPGGGTGRLGHDTVGRGTPRLGGVTRRGTAGGPGPVSGPAPRRLPAQGPQG